MEDKKEIKKILEEMKKHREELEKLEKKLATIVGIGEATDQSNRVEALSETVVASARKYGIGIFVELSKLVLNKMKDVNKACKVLIGLRKILDYVQEMYSIYYPHTIHGISAELRFVDYTTDSTKSGSLYKILLQICPADQYIVLNSVSIYDDGIDECKEMKVSLQQALNINEASAGIIAGILTDNVVYL